MKGLAARICTTTLLAATLALTTVIATNTPVLATSPTGTDTKQEITDGVNDVGGTGQGTNTVKDTIKNVINILLFLVGMIAVIMVVIAGFRFVTANGDQNAVTGARNTVVYAIIGIIVALLSYALVNFIINQIT